MLFDTIYELSSKEDVVLILHILGEWRCEGSTRDVDIGALLPDLSRWKNKTHSLLPLLVVTLNFCIPVITS